MPIRNEAAFITQSLGAVLAQDYPPDRIEVLIADGMSSDGTLDVIRAMPGADRVRIIPNPRLKQASGINLAVSEAQGDIIIRVDGHTIIAADYVRECVRALQETDAHNVGGPMNPVGRTLMGKAIAAAGKSPFAVPTAFHVSNEPQFTDTVYMGAWWKAVFDKVGGFDERPITNEDYELNYRIRRAGGKIYLTPRIQSVYYGRQTLRALWTQYFRYGVGKVYTLRLHPKSLRLRHLVAPVFVFVMVAGGVISLAYPVAMPLWLSVMTAYLVANLAASVHVFIFLVSDMRIVIFLPLVFFVIHVAWGTGFWYAALGRKT